MGGILGGGVQPLLTLGVSVDSQESLPGEDRPR